MAETKEKQEQSAEQKATSTVGSPTRKTQNQGEAASEPAEAGRVKAQVNPDARATSVFFPTGEDEDGVMQGITYEAGKVYDVDPGLLEVGNPPLLVEVEQDN